MLMMEVATILGMAVTMKKLLLMMLMKMLKMRWMLMTMPRQMLTNCNTMMQVMTKIG